jgi:spore coat protein U-like protein
LKDTHCDKITMVKAANKGGELGSSMQLLGKVYIFFLILGFCLSSQQAIAAQTCGDKGTCICHLILDEHNIDIKYNPILKAPIEAMFNFSVTCVLLHKGSEEVDYKIHFTPGHSDNIKYRHMHGSGDDILKYNIHQDHEHHSILGDGLGGMIELSHKYTLKQHTHHCHHEHNGEHNHQSPQSDHYTIHLEIPAQEFAKLGKYADSINVTLTY